MSELRNKFESLPDVKLIFDGLHPTIIWFSEKENLYATSFVGFDNKVTWLNGAWHVFQSQQSKIDELQKLRSLHEMEINQLAQANQVWQIKCDGLKGRIDEAIKKIDIFYMTNGLSDLTHDEIHGILKGNKDEN